MFQKLWDSDVYNQVKSSTKHDRPDQSQRSGVCKCFLLADFIPALINLRSSSLTLQIELLPVKFCPVILIVRSSLKLLRQAVDILELRRFDNLTFVDL